MVTHPNAYLSVNLLNSSISLSVPVRLTGKYDLTNFGGTLGVRICAVEIEDPANRKPVWVKLGDVKLYINGYDEDLDVDYWTFRRRMIQINFERIKRERRPTGLYCTACGRELSWAEASKGLTTCVARYLCSQRAKRARKGA